MALMPDAASRPIRLSQIGFQLQRAGCPQRSAIDNLRRHPYNLTGL